MSEQRVSDDLVEAMLCDHANDHPEHCEVCAALNDLLSDRRELEEKDALIADLERDNATANTARERAEKERDEARATKDLHKARQEQYLLRAQEAENERDEARKALMWLWFQLCAACDVGAIPKPDVPGSVVTAVNAARAAEEAHDGE